MPSFIPICIRRSATVYELENKEKEWDKMYLGIHKMQFPFDLLMLPELFPPGITVS